ncbi:MAG TPA: pyruvate kinase alpha/beta domain-containing protein, partial [Gemmatimonadaceae bacterium]|nr:pyruvate kinase alpha/beta domain-containing protein [Gemmatimonadaceae bacterium]
LARRSQADAIVAVTRQGYTARMLSALRPAAPIYAATPSPSVAERLALQWGVAPFVCTNVKGEEVERELVDCGAIARGTVIVFVSISAELHQEHSNFLRLRRIG